MFGHFASCLIDDLNIIPTSYMLFLKMKKKSPVERIKFYNYLKKKTTHQNISSETQIDLKVMKDLID